MADEHNSIQQVLDSVMQDLGDEETCYTDEMYNASLKLSPAEILTFLQHLVQNLHTGTRTLISPHSVLNVYSMCITPRTTSYIISLIDDIIDDIQCVLENDDGDDGDE